MSNKLIVVGGGGFAMEVCWLAEEAGWDVVGFLDDNPASQGKVIIDRPVLGEIASWRDRAGAQFTVAIGTPRTRKRVVMAMSEKGTPPFATLVHPTVCRSRFVRIGEGSIITAGCILTTDIDIGRHNILNLGVTVGHECRFGDFVTIAPLAAISGNVRLEDLVEVGTGAAIRQGLVVGERAIVGMGSALTRNVEPCAVYVGNPAKLLKSLED